MKADKGLMRLRRINSITLVAIMDSPIDIPLLCCRTVYYQNYTSFLVTIQQMTMALRFKVINGRNL